MTGSRAGGTRIPGIAGRNGVVVRKQQRWSGQSSGYRTYEVHQRERVGESTEKIRPVQLVSEQFRRDPYPLLSVLRENYPFYRDWLSNSYWVTRYDDVTSIFVDDANFTSLDRRDLYGLPDYGRDFGDRLELLNVEESCTDRLAGPLAETLLTPLVRAGQGDIARQFAALLPLVLLCEMCAIPESQRAGFTGLYWRMQRGISWQGGLQEDGRQAMRELESLLAPLVEARRADPGEDYLSVLLGLATEGEPPGVTDVVATLLERDHETLHGALANLWFLLLRHPEALSVAATEQRLMKLAYLEALRHSAPVLAAHRYARHEVERFGKLIPRGGRLVCSAAAANRDPAVFENPDAFVVDRRDLCQREPRGQYRADGLATGIAFGLGAPSKYPAIPEDRPRSRYAFTRDAAVTASMVLVDMIGRPELLDESIALQSLSVGEMHTAWRLPVRIGR